VPFGARRQAEYPERRKKKRGDAEAQRRKGTQSGEEKRKDGLRKYLYEKRDGIAYVTFNRPKVLECAEPQDVEELQHALLDARSDAAVRVLILTGAGEKAFGGRRGYQRTGPAKTPVNARNFRSSARAFSIFWKRWGAFDLRDQWICAGRRLRAGAFLHYSNRQAKQRSSASRK